jgi:hypothetical protein
LPALGTALGLVGETLGGKELLLTGAEGKSSPAIGTLDGLVFKTHWMTSSLQNFSWSSGHPKLGINLSGFKEACNNLNLNYYVQYTIKCAILQTMPKKSTIKKSLG